MDFSPLEKQICVYLIQQGDFSSSAEAYRAFRTLTKSSHAAFYSMELAEGGSQSLLYFPSTVCYLEAVSGEEQFDPDSCTTVSRALCYFLNELASMDNSEVIFDSAIRRILTAGTAMRSRVRINPVPASGFLALQVPDIAWLLEAAFDTKVLCRKTKTAFWEEIWNEWLSDDGASAAANFIALVMNARTIGLPFRFVQSPPASTAIHNRKMIAAKLHLATAVLEKRAPLVYVQLVREMAE